MEYQFDLQQHRNLIPRTPAQATPEIARQAERDVVDLYTVPRDGQSVVYLYEYDPDGMDDSEDVQEFLDNGFLPAVAEQIGWILLKRQANPLYSSHKLGKESVSYNEDMLRQQYPPDIERHLRPWDARPVI